MEFKRLKYKEGTLYDYAISLLENNFIYEERRDDSEQKRVLLDERFNFYVVFDEGLPCGIVTYWETDSFIYLEHLCVDKNIRGRGCGSRILDWLKKAGKIIILEIEVITNEITEKRKKFYERNNFVLNTHRHIQAKYHKGDDDLVMLIMSSDRAVTEKEYFVFYTFLVNNVGVQD